MLSVLTIGNRPFSRWSKRSYLLAHVHHVHGTSSDREQGSARRHSFLFLMDRFICPFPSRNSNPGALILNVGTQMKDIVVFASSHCFLVVFILLLGLCTLSMLAMLPMFRCYMLSPSSRSIYVGLVSVRS